VITRLNESRDQIINSIDFIRIINELVINHSNKIEGEEINYKQCILDWIKDHNLNTKEIYDWLIRNENNFDCSNSFVLLGDFYYLGIETNVNESKAFKYYKKAANSGNVTGTICLGYCYNHGIGNQNTRNSRKRSFDFYQHAAKQKSSCGMINLGYCYENGIGTEKNMIKANQWYKKSKIKKTK